MLALLLVLGGWWSLRAMNGGTEDWHAVSRGDLVLSVELTGTLQAVETSLIGPPQLGEVWQFKIARMAQEGTEVKAGTPVLVFDTSELDQRLLQQMAEAEQAAKEIEKFETEEAIRRQGETMQRAEAHARLRRAKMKVDVPTELAKAGELAAARLDLELADKEVAYLEQKRTTSERSAEATLAGLRNQHARAERTVQDIREAIAEMVRKAPRDGTVIYLSNWQDDKKKVGDTCWRGERVMELPDLGRMKALGQVREASAGKVVEGQQAKFRLDAHPDQEIEGRVRSIWRTVQQESWRTPQKVMRVEIELAQTDTQRMRPGMRFRGTIETERIAGVLLLPADAIVLSPDGPLVYRRAWRGSDAVAVKLGRRNEDQVEVLEGLSEGDEVSLRAPAGAGRQT